MLHIVSCGLCEVYPYMHNPPLRLVFWVVGSHLHCCALAEVCWQLLAGLQMWGWQVRCPLHLKHNGHSIVSMWGGRNITATLQFPPSPILKRASSHALTLLVPNITVCLSPCLLLLLQQVPAVGCGGCIGKNHQHHDESPLPHAACSIGNDLLRCNEITFSRPKRSCPNFGFLGFKS